MFYLRRKWKRITIKLRETYFNFMFVIFKKVPSSISEASGLRILVYHGICQKKPYLFNSRYITTTVFESHLRLLKKCFHVISLDDLIHNRLSPSKLNILVTLDDGLKNNYTYAFPLLKEYGIPAVFFSTGLPSTNFPYMFNDVTDVLPLVSQNQLVINNEIFYRKKIFLNFRLLNKSHVSLAQRYHSSSQKERAQVLEQLVQAVPIDKVKNYDTYFELMTGDELRIIANHPGYDIGSHGFYHTDLSSLSLNELQNEIQQSIQYLQSAIKKPIRSIAFPYGEYNQEVVDVCIRNAINYQFGTDKTCLVRGVFQPHERLTINPFISPINQMYYIVKNSYE